MSINFLLDHNRIYFYKHDIRISLLFNSFLFMYEYIDASSILTYIFSQILKHPLLSFPIIILEILH